MVKHQAVLAEEDVQDSNIARKDEPVIIQLREYLKFSGSLASKNTTV